jgi:hypothetical protein
MTYSAAVHPPSVPLTIETSYPFLRWSLALRSPRVTIDGQPVPVSWGRAVVPVFPGVHTVQINASGFGSPSQVAVDTRYGPQTVYYAASWTVWTGGSIGVRPVSSPGGGARIAMAVVPPLVVLVCLFGCLGLLFFGLCGGAFIPRQ